MPSVSAIVLTKDSERTIEACVKALKPAVDHVIVVDTGSFDNTVQIAKDSGARVYHFEWCDDFAATRNFGDSLATSDWVIHIDSDEILRREDINKIRKLCTQYRKTVDPIEIRIQQINTMDETTTIQPASRMYKRGVLVWHGIIHEYLIGKRGQKHYSVNSDVSVIHDGYRVDLKEKARRNLGLLRKGLELEPNSAAYNLFFGRESMVVGDYETAITYLRLSIDLIQQQSDSPSTLEYARNLLQQCQNHTTG